ncbi:hypothetical protein [Bradyrhizobium sp. NP1]|uniref:hypothetical protein n=1 Tax=Bradyrhizobium sp. NP1 TaxID=3049772 RepID=UPI0025A53B24|nr:hypothetical protein [Bradyrhizobium sp. NP1]WJR80434.1 hypothetical protein QOU61_11950 [Bradyrhizobium sp. NP1]
MKPLICPTAQAEYFSLEDWTTQISLKLLEKIRVLAHAISRALGRLASDGLINNRTGLPDRLAHAETRALRAARSLYPDRTVTRRHVAGWKAVPCGRFC